MYNKKVRYEYITVEESLPLFVESVGYNTQELDFSRPGGYPYYHWLQTVEGEGRFSFDGQEYILSKGRGILLKPFTPHTYFSKSKVWSTMYVTFGGQSVVSILESLKMDVSTFYTDLGDIQSEEIITDMLMKIESDSEFSKLDLSIYLYKFLVKLRKYGKMNNQPSLSHLYDKVRHIVEWLETSYGEDITLDDMASHLNVSSQYLNRLFQNTFKVSPYTFLIQLRIRKAKEILLQKPELPLKSVAILTGFNDVSYFVATFKKKEGITPKKYRDLFARKKRIPAR
ncbi:AraC family transcriptional regulator [Halalkalibacter urbisdiaboli]|uniref:AraC family transcriptional regulator n=1 Tax=Halalkalibacter urbisdiaboli TaxID=1960589 RepID=UPI001FDA087F|nr:AraC family transcriptional regulator [Halalkalibacter urbisdiaboli]